MLWSIRTVHMSLYCCSFIFPRSLHHNWITYHTLRRAFLCPVDISPCPVLPAFLCPVDTSPCPVLSAIVSQLFPPCWHQSVSCATSFSLPCWHQSVSCATSFSVPCWHQSVSCATSFSLPCWHQSVSCATSHRITTVSTLLTSVRVLCYQPSYHNCVHPADISPCPVLPAIVSQLFPPLNHL
jgi:hypothetical protein